MTSGEPAPKLPPPTPPPESPGEPPRIDFQTLCRGGREVLIEYRGQIYRLRETRNGKLILNK